MSENINCVERPCPLCQSLISVTAAEIGQQIQCPFCPALLEVPTDLGDFVVISQTARLTSFDLATGADDFIRSHPHETARVVMAIDFGTSRSGYAFAFTGDRLIQRRTRWPDLPYPYVKTLTNLLRSPLGEITAWGYTARTELARLIEENAAQGHELLTSFKTSLHTGQPTPEGPVVRLGENQTIPVVELIAAYMERLKDFALEELHVSTTGLLQPPDIFWCLTVPAIWTDADKQWMRNAAQRAGLIRSDPADAARLCLVLEPEAAALHCLEQEQQADPDHTALQPGTRFMVVDAGGGTVDITVHEVGPEGGLEEVVAGGGGLHGSMYVDQAFHEHLQSKLGKEVVERFHREKPFGVVKLLASWEQAKCGYWPGAKITFVPIPGELHRLLDRDYPMVLAELAADQDGDEDNIRLDGQTMASIFRNALDGIAHEVSRHFQKLAGRSCDYLFLVGGFAAAPLLQQRLRLEFADKVRKIVIPRDPGAAVLSGAVAFGLDPGRIRARRSRLTYGCRTLAPFSLRIDPEGKKVWHEETQSFCCRDRFQTFIRVGEAVGASQKVTHRFTVPERSQSDAKVIFYATPRKKPRYTDEPDAFEVGRLRVLLPDAGQDAARKVEISMYFGQTEITVEACDLTTGTSARTVLEFASTYFPPEEGE
jgi:hypothetical protein